MSEPQAIGNVPGGGLLSRLKETHAAYRKKMEAAATLYRSLSSATAIIDEELDDQQKRY